MADDYAEKREGLPAQARKPSPALGRTERVIAASVGVLAAGAGAIAVFVSQNGVGATALLGIGTLFLLASIFALVPTRLRVGDQEVEFQRAAADTVRRLLVEAEPEVREEIRQTLDEEKLNVQNTHASHEDVLARLTRGGGSGIRARDLYAELARRGWRPHPSPARNYLRWVYQGRQGPATVYQDSKHLVVAARGLRPLASTFPGASVNGKGEVQMPYTDVQQALQSLERLREHVDGPPAAT